MANGWMVRSMAYDTDRLIVHDGTRVLLELQIKRRSGSGDSVAVRGRKELQIRFGPASAPIPDDLEPLPETAPDPNPKPRPRNGAPNGVQAERSPRRPEVRRRGRS